MKRFICLFLSIVLVMGLCSCRKVGEPDRTGSWSQINQEITPIEGWKQLVTNSAFSFGERRLAGSWQVPDGKVDYYKADYGTYPCIDGSTVCVPMAVEFARQHLGLSGEDVNSFVLFNTTDYAYQNLISKQPISSGTIRSTNTLMNDSPVDLILVTEPSAEELALAQEKNVELMIEPICLDAFVFITHKSNPVDSLTVEQIQKIYSGEITNWKEVGGLDQKIIAYQREENSGSQTTMENRVMQGKKMLEPNIVNVVAGMGELVKTVGEYENSPSSIGYTFKYYIDSLYKNENIKVLKVENIAASDDTLQNKSYPFTTPYYGVIRAEDRKAVGGKFLDWMLTAQGQRCIEQAGYCPILKE